MSSLEAKLTCSRPLEACSLGALGAGTVHGYQERMFAARNHLSRGCAHAINGAKLPSKSAGNGPLDHRPPVPPRSRAQLT